MSQKISPLEQARRRGVQLAAREHSSLGTDLTEPIDIFSILTKREIDVMFRPLNPLYGAYLCGQGIADGILINVNHPPGLQRFTAAHEYGHRVMGHGTAYDEEAQIVPGKRRHTVQEVEAQTFAAYFLMPLKLVQTLLHRMELPLQLVRLSPHDAYQLSLRLGVSYTAVVTHLQAIKKIDQETASNLQSVTPKAIKTQIGQGTGPQNSWADVWTFDERDNGKHFSIYVHDELHFYLPETSFIHQDTVSYSSGGQSAIQVISMKQEIETRENALREANMQLVQHSMLRASTPGQAIIRWGIRDEGKGVIQTASSFEITLHVQQRPRSGLNTW
jgi:Zn-dependent peptidase ImmA (M78 family)